MRKIHLIIETPRGGDFGHRLLSAPGFGNEWEIARIADAANRNLMGEDYLAVSRPAQQILANGTIRNGTDTIVLAGIDIKAIGFKLQQQIRDHLDHLFPKLDELIKEVHWSAESGSTMIFRKELNDWLNEDLYRNIPLAPDKTSSTDGEIEPTGPKLWRAWLGGGLMAMILILLVVKFWRRPPPIIVPPPEPDIKAQLEALAKEWNCSSNAVANSIVRVKNWDGRLKSVPDNQELDNGYVVDMLKSLAEKKGKDCFRVSLKKLNNDGFEKFVENHLDGDEKCISFRKNLYSVWDKYRDLKEKTKGIEGMVPGSDPDPVFNALVVFSKMEMESGFGDHFQEAKTPLLDRQDLMIYNALKKWMEHPKLMALRKSTNNDLRTTLQELPGEEIIMKIISSRKNMSDAARNNKDISDNKEREKNGSAVNDAYLSLQAFFEAILKINEPH